MMQGVKVTGVPRVQSTAGGGGYKNHGKYFFFAIFLSPFFASSRKANNT